MTWNIIICNFVCWLQARYPARYIYEPWKAPLSVQRESGCVIGEGYPKPIVQHEIVSKQNMEKMKLAYNASSSTSSSMEEQGNDEENERDDGTREVTDGANDSGKSSSRKRARQK